MEISYTKQQQKQKQKQQNKSHDADTMQAFDKRFQITLTAETDNYYQDTLSPATDKPKLWLGMPLAAPIVKLRYTVDGVRRFVSVYPTLQFLYSHHIHPEYITPEVHELALAIRDETSQKVCAAFLSATEHVARDDVDKGGAGAGTAAAAAAAAEGDSARALDLQVLSSHVRQNPQFTLAGVRPGVFVIGMKDQFNPADLAQHPLAPQVRYVADEMGFILHDATGADGRSVDAFGPYGIELYLLLETLSKQEVAQTVLEYYVHQKAKLQRGVEQYDERQGKGFICWRFFDAYRQPK